MKLLILACLLGISAASLVQRAAPQVDQAILAFYQGAAQAGSLSDALGVDEPWIQQAEDDIKTELGKALKDAFNELLQKIKDEIDHGKTVGKELLDKVRELKNKLKETGVDIGNKGKDLIKKIREKAKDALRDLLDKLGLGKRNLDDQMDAVARSKLSDSILEKIMEKILSDETIQKIRDYIKGITHDSDLVRKLKEAMEKLRDSDIREFLRHIFGHKSGASNAVARGETWDKIKNFFKDLKIKITEHTKKFGEWVKDAWGKGLDKLKAKYGTIKAIAMEFIAHGKDVSAEVAREALEFFRPYKDDLGELWKQIVEAAKQAIGQF